MTQNGRVETADIIYDHRFEPEGEWWTRCKHCRLAEAAHARTTGPPGDDKPPDKPVGRSDPEDGGEPDLPLGSTWEVNMLDIHPTKEKPDGAK